MKQLFENLTIIDYALDVFLATLFVGNIFLSCENDSSSIGWVVALLMLIRGFIVKINCIFYENEQKTHT